MLFSWFSDSNRKSDKTHLCYMKLHILLLLFSFYHFNQGFIFLVDYFAVWRKGFRVKLQVPEPFRLLV